MRKGKSALRQGTFALYLCAFSSFGGAFPFRPTLFHHFGNASLGGRTETATSATPSIAWYRARLAATPSTISPFKSGNSLIETITLCS
jgi:hypothetical protein